MLPAPDARLDFAAKLGQRSLAARVDGARSGLASQGPVVVELDVTTACDLACPECISQDVLRTGRFSVERLSSLPEEFAQVGVRSVILIGGGEPLLHPGVSHLIDRFANHDIQIGLTTNGTQLHRHMDAVAAGAAWTRVSVDAATQRTYARFRPARRSQAEIFDRVISNMRVLARRKTGVLGFSYLLICRRHANGVVLEHNFDEVLAAARLARDVGCEYIEFKPEYDLSHQLVPQPPDLVAELRIQLGQAAELESESFKVIAPRHLETVLSAGSLDQPKPYRRCPMAQLRALVTPTGVYVCPYHRGSVAARYGDLRSQTFPELWASGTRRELAASFDPSKYCRFSCIRHEANLAILTGGVAATVDDHGDYFV